MKTLVSWLALSITVGGAAGAAHAQTCSVDQTGTFLQIQTLGVPIVVDGTIDGVLVNGDFCGQAPNVTVLGHSGLADNVTLRGMFASGQFDLELDVIVQLRTDPGDVLTVELSNGPDLFEAQAATGYLLVGTDLGFYDLRILDVDTLKVKAFDGNDDVEVTSSMLDVAEFVLYAGGGNDTVDGTQGPDRLYGGPGDDDMFGWLGNDVFDGGPGADLLAGMEGNDRFDDTSPSEAWAGVGDDMVGGSGVDTVSYQGRTGRVFVTMDGVAADDGESGERDMVREIERAIGGSGDDELVGNASANRLTGGAGNDALRGGDGNDKLYGGPGDDDMFGEAGTDQLFGEAGNDILLGGSGSDTLSGGDDSDVLDGGGSVDSYAAGAGDDFLYNSDSKGEMVDCGEGTDDAEADPLDSFSGCEL